MQHAFWLAALLALLVPVQDGVAQVIYFDGASQPLEEALLSLQQQAGIDVVFAHHLVDGRSASCRYRGRDPEEAMDCLLQDTRLRFQRVRKKQYVLIGPETEDPAEPHNAGADARLDGQVVDAASGEVLPGAHVYLPDLKRGTVADRAGRFTFQSLPPRRQRARISYLGYQMQDTVLTPGAARVQITLQPVTLQTSPVDVEDERSDREGYSEAPGLVNMPVQQLEEFPSFVGGQDLFQAFQWLPGVRHSGEVNGGLVVQGGTPDQNLYLLDGAPIYHPWHAFSLISTFQTGTFRQVKLYRGTFPAEHGGRLSSVLEAEMKDGSSRPSPRATAALGLLSGRFQFESPVTDKTSFMVAGRRSYLDKLVGRQHSVVGSDGHRDTLRTGYYFYDMTAKAAHQLNPRHRLTLSYYHGRDNLDLRLPFDVSLDFASWLKPAPLFFEVGHNWENRLYSLRLRSLASHRLFVTTTAYYSGYHAEEQTLLHPAASTRIASDYRVRLNDAGFRVDADYFYDPRHQVRTGVQAVVHSFRSSLDAHLQRSLTAVDSVGQQSRHRDVELVGYLQNTWQPSPRWRLQPGLRASFFSGGQYAHLRPRINVQYALIPDRLHLNGALGMKVQYMHRLRDRYSFLYDLVSSRWIPTSEAVRPSTSRQAALGVEGTPWSWLTLQANGYWKDMQNALLPQDVFQTKDGLDGPGIEVGSLLGQYTPAEGKDYGLELSARVEQAPWRAWVSYAGGRSLSRTLALGEEAFRPDRFDVPRSLRGVLSRSGQRWSVTASTELRSGLPQTVPVARYALGDPLDEEARRYLSRPQVNNGRLPPYLRFDLALGYRFEWLGGAWQAQVQLYNVTNNRNVVRREYDPRPDEVTVRDRYGLPTIPLFELQVQL